MYTETHDESNFKQGLNIGDEAIFTRTGDKYVYGETDGLYGWEKVPEKVVITGFDYPFIRTDKGNWHYSRFVKKTGVQQLKLF